MNRAGIEFTVASGFIIYLIKLDVQLQLHWLYENLPHAGLIHPPVAWLFRLIIIIVRLVNFITSGLE